MKKFFMMILCFLLAAGIIVGCASVEERTKMLSAKYPQWDPAMVKKVAEGVVTPGMTPDMVKEAMGRKGERIPGDKQGEETWVYYREEEYGQAPHWIPVYYVFFKNGIVTRTREEKEYVPQRYRRRPYTSLPYSMLNNETFRIE